MMFVSEGKCRDKGGIQDHETLDGTDLVLTQSDIISSLSNCFLFTSAANELAAQHSNTWLVLAVASAA